MSLGIGHGPQGPANRAPGARASRPRVPRTDRIATLWMLVALGVGVVTALARGHLPQPLWTSIHIFTIGVASNAILQWSWYFTRTLLRLPPDSRHAGRDNTVRIVALNLAFCLLIVSMWRAWVVGTVTAATVVGVVAAWHGIALVLAARSALLGRFRIVISHYAWAGAWLVLACAFAGAVTVAMFTPAGPEGAWVSALAGARNRLTLAHALSAGLGWVGLTVAGTLLTLGPTALRTRMAEGAERRARTALPLWNIGLALAVVSACAAHPLGIGIGLLGVAVALTIGTCLPLASALRRKAPREHGAVCLVLGSLWLALGVLVVALHAFLLSGAGMSSDLAADLRTLDLPWLAVIGAGGLAQLIVGALAFLMPVVIGGGPSAVRVGIRTLDRTSTLRVTIRNGSLLVLALLTVADTLEGLGITESPVATASPELTVRALWLLVLASYAADVVVLARASIAQARAKRAATTGRGPHPSAVTDAPPPATDTPTRTTGRDSGPDHSHDTSDTPEEHP